MGFYFLFFLLALICSGLGFSFSSFNYELLFRLCLWESNGTWVNVCASEDLFLLPPGTLRHYQSGHPQSLFLGLMFPTAGRKDNSHPKVMWGMAYCFNSQEGYSSQFCLLWAIKLRLPRLGSLLKVIVAFLLHWGRGDSLRFFTYLFF